MVVQAQDANPNIRSGEVPCYEGILDWFPHSDITGDQAFWDGNLTKCVHYYPMQVFNLAFKDSFKNMFPNTIP